MLAGDCFRGCLHGIVALLQKVVYNQVCHLTGSRAIASLLVSTHALHDGVHEFPRLHLFGNELANHLRVVQAVGIAYVHTLFFANTERPRFLLINLLCCELLELLLFALVEVLLEFVRRSTFLGVADVSVPDLNHVRF